MGQANRRGTREERTARAVSLAEVQRRTRQQEQNRIDEENRLLREARRRYEETRMTNLWQRAVAYLADHPDDQPERRMHLGAVWRIETWMEENGVEYTSHFTSSEDRDAAREYYQNMGRAQSNLARTTVILAPPRV